MALAKQDLDRLLGTAVTAMQRGDFVAAHEAASQGINAGAEHPLLLKIEALWLHANGHYRDALRMFHHARTLTPEDPSILNGIAGSLAGMGAYSAALKITDESLRIAPNVAATHHLRGWILELRGELAPARQAYERALAFSPNFLEAAAGIALVAAQTKDYGAARSYAASVMAVLPHEPNARIAMAIANAAQGKASLAENELNAIIASESLPNRIRAVAWGAVADALEAQQRPVEAASARAKKDELLSAEPAPIEEAVDEFDTL